MVGLNVVLGNSSITLYLEEAEATRMVRAFQGEVAHKPIEGGTTVDGQSWAFRMTECKGLFTFDPEKLKQQQPQSPSKYGAWETKYRIHNSGI